MGEDQDTTTPAPGKNDQDQAVAPEQSVAPAEAPAQEPAGTSANADIAAKAIEESPIQAPEVKDDTAPAPLVDGTLEVKDDTTPAPAPEAAVAPEQNIAPAEAPAEKPRKKFLGIF